MQQRTRTQSRPGIEARAVGASERRHPIARWTSRRIQRTLAHPSSPSRPYLACHASSLPPEQPPDPAEQIAATLAEHGWCVTDDFVAPLHVGQLRHEAQARWQAGCFRRAGVGRGQDLAVRDEVRTDRVHWLDPGNLSAAQRLYWGRLEQLRLAINRSLFLGLYELEAHLAVYPPGTYYRKHLDQFRGIGERTLSCILYLNETWQPRDGGALRLYTDPHDPERSELILPEGGRLVSFLSARFLHEVEPAQRERFSLTGWLKRRR